MKFSAIFFIILFISFWHYSVLGQKLFFEKPVILSDTINSAAEESYPIYSDSDSTLYFVRTLYAENTGGKLSGQDIWFSKRTDNGKWSIPKNDLPNLNNRNNNAVVGIASSGKTIYALNTYGEKNVAKQGLSFSFNRENQWQAPKQIVIPGLDAKQGNYYSIYVTPSEDIAIISMQNDQSIGLEDLFISLKDSSTNQWSKLIHLGPSINTSGFEISPFLSKDKKTLFFSSNGHPGYGNADIFYAQRLDSTWTHWTQPENLGDGVNSVGFDAYLTINNMDEAFFVSNRNGGSADVYYANTMSEEERADQLASRIQNRGNIPLFIQKENSAATETQALISETQRLLEAFKKGKNSGESTADDASLNTETVYFDLNADEVKQSAMEDLTQVLNQLKRNNRLNAKIVGHADDTGGSDYNLKLSISRAQAIKQYLVDHGIDEGRIITFGKGSTQPASDNQSPEGRTKNRRVEISFFSF